MEGTRSTQPALYSILWACTLSWHYGFHLAELNYPADSLTCLPSSTLPASVLPLCLGLDSHRYSIVTAIYTVGGLLGSLGSSWLVGRDGVKGGLMWAAWLDLFAVIGMTMAPHWLILAAGRFVAGVSSGVAICLVPPFLSVIARASPQLSARSGQVGTLHQMAIVIGLFTAQAAGMIFTGAKGDVPGKWRYVVALSGIVSGLQIAMSGGVFEPDMSSKHPQASHRHDDEQGLSPVPEADEGKSSLRNPASPLLPEPPHGTQNPTSPGQHSEAQLSLRELLSNQSLRGPTVLCASILALQQLCGVNAVMFYSAPVLKPLLPSLAGAISIGITFINALTTVVAIFLVDRLGRRPLLLGSIAGMALMSASLAFGLNNNLSVLSAIAIILFIVAYSVGLGPVPFLLVSETVPAPGIPALSSLSLSLSWISAFIIAILFLPLRDAMSSPVDPGDPISPRRGEGRVFYVFTAICAFTALLVWRGLGKPQ